MMKMAIDTSESESFLGPANRTVAPTMTKRKIKPYKTRGFSTEFSPPCEGPSFRPSWAESKYSTPFPSVQNDLEVSSRSGICRPRAGARALQESDHSRSPSVARVRRPYRPSAAAMNVEGKAIGLVSPLHIVPTDDFPSFRMVRQDMRTYQNFPPLSRDSDII